MQYRWVDLHDTRNSGSCAIKWNIKSVKYKENNHLYGRGITYFLLTHLAYILFPVRSISFWGSSWGFLSTIRWTSRNLNHVFPQILCSHHSHPIKYLNHLWIATVSGLRCNTWPLLNKLKNNIENYFIEPDELARIPIVD